MVDKKGKKKQQLHGTRPSDLEKKQKMALRYTQLLSAWYYENPLDFLTVNDITKRANKKLITDQRDQLKLSTDTARYWLKKGLKDGLFEKNSDDQYRPTTIDESANMFAPIFLIKNRNFNSYFPLILSPYEILYLYFYKQNEKDLNDGIPIGIYPEIKKLGEIIKKELQKFYLKTGFQPRLAAFTYDRNLIDPRSYVQLRLEFEVYSAIHQNLKNISITADWFDDQLKKDFNHAIIVILQKALVNNIEKRKDLNDIQKNKLLARIAEGNLLNLTSIAISLNLLITDELEPLIQKEAKNIFTNLQTRKN